MKKFYTFLKHFLPREEQSEGFSKEKAYSRSLIGKDVSLEALEEFYYNRIMKEINREVGYSTMECLIYLPPLPQQSLSKIIERIGNVYTVLYSDQHVCLVSWRVQ